MSYNPRWIQMKREYPEYPIPAVSGVVFDSRGRILFVKRKNPPLAGTWSLPGGAVRLGEELREALKREIGEECGIRVEVVSFLSASSRIVPEGKERIHYHFVLLNYLCTFAEGEAIAGSDAMEVRWVPPDEIDSLGVSEEILAVIQKASEVMVKKGRLDKGDS